MECWRPKAVNYCCKKFHLRCLGEPWIRLRLFLLTWLKIWKYVYIKLLIDSTRFLAPFVAVVENGIRKTPTRKIPTQEIPTHVFKYSNPRFFRHRYHWYYIKDCFVVLFLKVLKSDLSQFCGLPVEMVTNLKEVLLIKYDNQSLL